MPPNQQYTLLHYMDDLMDVLEIKSLLRGLLKRKVLTKTLVFDVSKQKSQDRMKRLIEILFTRGASAYQEFCETVKDEGEFDLAYRLQRDAYNVEKEIFW